MSQNPFASLLHYTGRVRFASVYCIVPINATDPIGWAKKLAQRQLKMTEFGWCRVNGGETDGTFKPTAGVSERGRLVILTTPSAYFYDWQRRQIKKS